MLRFSLLLFVTVLFGCAVEPSTEVTRPNVLLILTDDQGYGDLGLHGNDSIDTPNLDRLGRESVRFERFYVSPVCAPTRASLLTGRYHHRTGVSWVTHRKEVMRSEETTLAELLRDHGYRTGIFGKWHNGEQYPNDPTGQGFEEFWGFSAGHWNNYFNTTLTHNRRPVQTEGYLPDYLTDRALDFIQRDEVRPWFCYVPYPTPHTPVQVPDAYFDKYQQRGLTDYNAGIYGMVENIDDNVGRLLAALETSGQAENTIVLFLTDNGPNGNRYNGGMRGAKASVHEGGVRVPLFVRYPNGDFPVKIDSSVTGHIDILPTLATLCDIEVNRKKLDGIDLTPLLRGKEKEVNRWFFTFPIGQKVRPEPGAIRTDRYRYVLNRQGEDELYDMWTDPAEQYSLADSMFAETAHLRHVYQQMFKKVTADYTGVPPIPVGHVAAPDVWLPAPEAELIGGLKFSEHWGWANDWIVNWTQPTDTIRWHLDVHEPGTYTVELHYAATEAQVGAEISVATEREAISVAALEAFAPEVIPSPDRSLRKEVYEQTWGKQRLGVVRLDGSTRTFSLNTTSTQSAGVAAVKGIILRRIEK